MINVKLNDILEIQYHGYIILVKKKMSINLFFYFKFVIFI
jgi:hypothetical protein